ncbi:MAG TPA: ACT domain-containing protein [Oscillibacter sp.]|nr:ACT domain-containing protein [Oscillibacter sp.]
MKAIITVIGKDRVGIIAGVSSLLAQWNVNVLDISQTILQENFTMVMLADLADCPLSFAELTEKLSALGMEMDIAIRMQREDIFNAMHKI